MEMKMGWAGKGHIPNEHRKYKVGFYGAWSHCIDADEFK